MSRQSAQSAERCLDILELLLIETPGLGVSQIAQRLNLPISATHRLVQVLVDKGYAAQTEGSAIYAATRKIAILGLRQLAGHEITRLSEGILEQLARETSELARLAVRDGDSLIWISKSHGSNASIRHDPINGREVPLHTTAMGKAWLATMPDAEIEARIGATGFKSELTGPNAIRDMNSLHSAIKNVRLNGYATAIEESELGLCAVAMVLRDRRQDRRVVGAVSIAGPSYRVDRAKLEEFLPALKRAVAEIEALWPVT